MSLIDKRSILQVIGSLIQKTSLLDEDKYKLDKDDFFAEGESSFYTIIFAAINNLYDNEIEAIDLMMIDSFLSNYEIQYKIFNDNDGLDYLQKAIDNSNLKNFEYNYNRLKKYSLLREYQANGFDVTPIYDDSIISPKDTEEMMEKFDAMTIQDIIDHFEEKQVSIRNKFVVEDKVKTEKAGEGSRELFQKFKETPDFGISLIGDIQNTIFRGAKLKTIGMRSAPSNLGKTRIALAEATDMSIDEIYDLKQKKWVKKGSPEKVLFISTEMERDRLEPTMWAYISGIPEAKIKDGATTPEEDKRIEHAISILERSQFWIDYIPDFNTSLIEAKIKQHILENQTQYIYFDYVHISMSIMQEIADQSRGMKLREDMILFMFVNRLEQLAKKYNVWIQTASQVNGEWKNAKDADSTILRGAKNMADKLFRGIVALTPTNSDLEAIEPILKKGFYKKPNVVYHIYKNRETRYKDCKLWLYIDMDTMRMEELFLTNNDYELINIQPTEIKTKQYDF